MAKRSSTLMPKMAKRRAKAAAQAVDKVFNRAGREVEVIVPENDPKAITCALCGAPGRALCANCDPENLDSEGGGARWIVMCRVSGGVTGTREAVLKANGVTQYFGSEAAARAKAQELNAKMNNAYSVANFKYWPALANIDALCW